MLKNLVMCFFQAGFKVFLLGLISVLLLVGIYNDLLEDFFIAIFAIFFLTPFIYGILFFLLFLPFVLLKKDELVNSTSNEILNKYLPIILIPAVVLIMALLLKIVNINFSGFEQILLLHTIILAQFGLYLIIVSYKKIIHESR